MTFFDISTATQHQNAQFGMEDVSVDLAFSEPFPHGTSEQDLFMWADADYFAPLHQGTYPASGSLLGPEQAQPEHMDMCSDTTHPNRAPQKTLHSPVFSMPDQVPNRRPDKACNLTPTFERHSEIDDTFRARSGRDKARESKIVLPKRHTFLLSWAPFLPHSPRPMTANGR